MAKKIVRTPEADLDLLLIADYGTRQWGIEASIKFARTFNDAFRLLAQHPEIGRSRDELRVGVRSWIHRGYVIYHSQIGDKVMIARVLHGAVDPAPHFPSGEVPL